MLCMFLIYKKETNKTICRKSFISPHLFHFSAPPATSFPFVETSLTSFPLYLRHSHISPRVTLDSPNSLLRQPGGTMGFLVRSHPVSGLNNPELVRLKCLRPYPFHFSREILRTRCGWIFQVGIGHHFKHLSPRRPGWPKCDPGMLSCSLVAFGFLQACPTVIC